MTSILEDQLSQNMVKNVRSKAEESHDGRHLTGTGVLHPSFLLTDPFGVGRSEPTLPATRLSGSGARTAAFRPWTAFFGRSNGGGAEQGKSDFSTPV